MQSATVDKQSGQSLIGASSNTFGIEDPDSRVYSLEEKHAAFGRHNVSTLKVSSDEIVGMGVVGGLAGAAIGGLAKAVGDYSWRAVAIAGATGAAIGMLGTFFSAESMTPLEHAQYKLDLAKSDQATLLNSPLNEPSYQCRNEDVFTIRKIANRCEDSWDSLWLLWECIYPPSRQSNELNLQENLYIVLRDRHSIEEYDIQKVSALMSNANALDKAKNLPEFIRLVKKSSIPYKDQNEVAAVMYLLNRAVAKEQNLQGTPSIYDLYQELCKSKYSHYKAYLEQDIHRLEDDIRILKSVERTQQAPVATTSAPT